MNKLNEEELENATGGTVITIRVAPGDTLGALALRFRCTVEDICRWNGIEDPNVIEVGQKLKFKF